MRKYVGVVAVLMSLSVSQADAGDPHPLIAAGINRGPGPLDNLRLSPALPAARLQPVVGSVQRTGRFTNPFTHKAKYTQTVLNPLTGHFGKMKFKR